MSKAKHTAGPWHKGAGNGEGSIFKDGEGRMRCESGGTGLYPIASIVTGWHDEEDQANATLIAAAPDLLTSLEEMERKYGKLHDGLSDLIGDGEGPQRLSPADIPDDYRWLADTLAELVGVAHRCKQVIAKAKGGRL